MRGIGWLLVAISLTVGLPASTGAEERKPMSRERFAELIHRGVPQSDVLQVLGKPDEKKPAQNRGSTDWVYLDRVINPGSGKLEPVTVIIFEEYQTVGDVRWADGSIAE